MADIAALFPEPGSDGFGLISGSMSQPHRIKESLPFGILLPSPPQSMEISVLPGAAKWKLIAQSDIPTSERRAWLSSITKLLAGFCSDTLKTNRRAGFTFGLRSFFW